MKVLFIDACIREKSRTRKLCEYYISSHYSNEDTVDKVILSKLKLVPINSDILNKREKYIQMMDYSSSIFDFAKQFAAADEIIIGAPLWDYSFPSILKVYFEHICVNGITFGYDEKGQSLALCHGKKLIYIMTSGGYLPKENSLEMHMNELCRMFGIPVMKMYSAQGLDIYGNHADEILKRTRNEMETEFLQQP